ncbi:MAG: lipoate--protein ligase family protein [Chloroflexi bacterium]|nr:lipoate--protein ligase family protein [Chloroflexota bacterium]
MAVDEAILEAVGRGDQPPTLRLYAWSPACLSLGIGQKATDADHSRIVLQGWNIVRRPTGGRAILHTDELTYSVSVPSDHPWSALDIVTSYCQISAALMRAVESLGADPHAERRGEPSPAKPGPVCFEVPSHYEITVEGRKLIGSAQVRRRHGLLQHGSLPLTGDLARICDALAYPDDETREAARIQVRRRAVTLSEALGRNVTWQQSADAIAAAFASAFDIAFSPSVISRDERTRADLLEHDKYGTISARQAV